MAHVRTPFRDFFFVVKTYHKKEATTLRRHSQALGIFMGSTFVSIKKKGFWLDDYILELWLRFAALHIEDSPLESSEEHKIRDQWLIASRGYFNGCVPHDFEEVISTGTGKKIVIAAINSLLSVLRDSPALLNKDVLNLMGFSGHIEGDIETYRLIEISEAMLNLISGKVGSIASDTSFTPGCN